MVPGVLDSEKAPQHGVIADGLRGRAARYEQKPEHALRVLGHERALEAGQLRRGDARLGGFTFETKIRFPSSFFSNVSTNSISPRLFFPRFIVRV